MTLLRFVGVLLLVTLLAGGVGAAAGALFGVGMPRQMQVEGQSHGPRSSDERDTASGGVGMQVQADRSPVVIGTAWGGGLGLLIGGPCGLVVALLDQLAISLRERNEPA
jgi:hypothetical protein